MENNEITIKRIPLDIFIDALEKLYNMGVDYVDIVGSTAPAQDKLGLVFTEDYLSPDSPLRAKQDGEEIDISSTEIDFTGDDLNDLA